METITVFGTIAPDGRIISGSREYFEVVKDRSAGTYNIIFKADFKNPPSMVGSQTGFGSGQNTLDNVIFPNIELQSAVAITGDSGGSYQDRQFSFIAIGAI